MHQTFWPSKDPDSVEPYFLVWCDKTGLNSGSALDKGELQGATISSATWTILPAGELVSTVEDTPAITINGTAYAINTVCTIWLSGGEPDTVYALTCTVDLSDNRTLEKTVYLRVEEK